MESEVEGRERFEDEEGDDGWTTFASDCASWPAPNSALQQDRQHVILLARQHLDMVET